MPRRCAEWKFDGARDVLWPIQTGCMHRESRLPDMYHSTSQRLNVLTKQFDFLHPLPLSASVYSAELNLKSHLLGLCSHLLGNVPAFICCLFFF